MISNHEDLRGMVEWHGVGFRCVPVGPEPVAKAAAFDEMERVLEHERADVIVLARYMQILPPPSAPPAPDASSTSTTRSCRRSPAPAPTTRPSSGA